MHTLLLYVYVYTYIFIYDKYGYIHIFPPSPNCLPSEVQANRGRAVAGDERKAKCAAGLGCETKGKLWGFRQP
jgi:hypothetical protein